MNYTKLSIYAALAGSVFTATISGYELLADAPTNLSLVTNSIALVGSLLLVLVAGTMLLDSNPPRQQLD